MKEFEKVIMEIAGRHGMQQVFDDFLQLAVCAFAHGRMEERYLKVIKRYEKAEAQLFAKLLAVLVKEYTRVITADGSWQDPLGDFFMEHNSRFSASARGQFFTPPEIANLMAQMTEMPNLETGTVIDPAGGSGRNLIAHAKLDANNRMRYMYISQDLDQRCTWMAILNFLMNGMRGYVFQMNTLSMEIYAGYRVYLPETCLGVRPMAMHEIRGVLFTKNKAVPEDAKTPYVEIGKQLDIFA